MRLAELIAGETVSSVSGDAGTEITGLSYDSRMVKSGDLFFSLARDAERNREYLNEALNRGARALVVRGWDGGAARPAAVIIECDRPRHLMATV